MYKQEALDAVNSV